MGDGETDDVLTAAGGWPGVLTALVRGQDLPTEVAEAVMTDILTGGAGPARIAAFATALRIKGETVDEMVGLVRAMYAHAEVLDVTGDVVDVVGTGGDRLGSINVSTLAALIVAGTGQLVCKHGGRAASSAVGTADVFEALGVVPDLGPEGVKACLEQAGMAFCFAPRFHPAMAAAVPVRRELGVPTVFNFLGPLANPARARYQLVGVSDPGMAETMVGVLGANGSRHAMVVYADDGLDELSVTSGSTVLELVGRPEALEVRKWRVEPEDVGLTRCEVAALRGGDAAWNARVIRRVLDGEQGGPRDIGLLNAAAALVVADRCPTLEEGVATAARSVDEGGAASVLERLATVSTEAAGRAAGTASSS
jgi:anthranilate phosphoribosyltransferase